MAHLYGRWSKNGEVSVGHTPLLPLAGEQDFPFFVRDVSAAFLAVMLINT